ncbi:exodeoxyribonuclease III [Fulvivirga sedimenti]|uniref:Exodeoxyribonuclease III n=1 Tax=Fulvivirga sedimenti TaxID=2879465 RepID=A0A9X1HKK4_9BACT|nr:exodeoxyribonuclease III [Fulvivirga sedimenti]MCA6073903.1 exodeoxyribonuclease III [Fulvivirga sedimenti]
MSKIKLATWNVNGIRAIMKKEFESSFNELNSDVLCLQETKATADEVKEALVSLDSGFEIYANESKARKGYSGTAVISRIPVIGIQEDMGMAEHDQEGRVLAAEFGDFFLVNVYTPNSGQGLKRLDYRQEWDRDFLQYLKALEASKPVIVAGDLNVAHSEIDLARPKQNYNKSSGYTQQEIDGLTNIIKNGFIDVFRHLYPDQEGAYTYWNYMFNARSRNVGWRIDYFLASENILPKIDDVVIRPEFMGSDHCPVELWIEAP